MVPFDYHRHELQLGDDMGWVIWAPRKLVPSPTWCPSPTGVNADFSLWLEPLPRPALCPLALAGRQWPGDDLGGLRWSIHQDRWAQGAQRRSADGAAGHPSPNPAATAGVVTISTSRSRRLDALRGRGDGHYRPTLTVKTRR